MDETRKAELRRELNEMFAMLLDFNSRYMNSRVADEELKDLRSHLSRLLDRTE